MPHKLHLERCSIVVDVGTRQSTKLALQVKVGPVVTSRDYELHIKFQYLDTFPYEKEQPRQIISADTKRSLLNLYGDFEPGLMRDVNALIR